MDAAVVSVLGAGAGREAVDLALRDEGRVRADPRLVDVEELQRVLLLVLPLHVLLLVADGVPPYVEKSVGPGGALDEEGAEIEAGAVLGHDEVDGLRFAVANGAAGFGVKVWAGEGVGYVEWVVGVDIAVGVCAEVVEDVGLEGVGWLHYESVEIHPPEPVLR